MPGSFFTLVCPGCSAEHEISTGADFSAEHREPWGYLQLVCTRCQTIRSQRDPDLWDENQGQCLRCRQELIPWTGKVWHERTLEGHVGAERVEGPCPKCGTQLTLANATTIGLWD